MMDPAAKRAAFEALKERAGNGRVVPEKRKHLTGAQKAAIIERQDGVCACGCESELWGKVEFDHRIPLALGGVQTTDNFVAMNRDCHARKTRRDVTSIAKAKRLERREVEGPKPSQIQSRNEWPKGQKLQSRGFDKSRRASS